MTKKYLNKNHHTTFSKIKKKKYSTTKIITHFILLKIKIKMIIAIIKFM